MTEKIALQHKIIYPRPAATACAQFDGAAGQLPALPIGPDGLASERLFELTVAHIDCDAFYASIEKRDHPELAGLPVIVGGGKRGVVSTCCYIARTYGVRSAMPMFKALKLCPDAVVIKGRMDLYVAGRPAHPRDDAGRSRLWWSRSPSTRPISTFPAPTPCTAHRPLISLMKLQKQVERELGLTISVGLASNKFLAKTASEADKPRGFFVLSHRRSARLPRATSPCASSAASARSSRRS